MPPAVLESPNFLFCPRRPSCFNTSLLLASTPRPTARPPGAERPPGAAPPRHAGVQHCFPLHREQGLEQLLSLRSSPFVCAGASQTSHKHTLSLAAAFHSPVGNCLVLLRCGAPAQAGMGPSLHCFLGLGGGPACPSETKPSGHPPAARSLLPKGPCYIPPSLPTSFALASVDPSVKRGCCGSPVDLDAAPGHAERLLLPIFSGGFPP